MQRSPAENAVSVIARVLHRMSLMKLTKTAFLFIKWKAVDDRSCLMYLAITLIVAGQNSEGFQK